MLINIKKASNTDNSYLKLFLLLVAGLEPARCCHRGILSPLRLPIPPHQLTLIIGYGAYRARTYDPLLVRQMLSQLS